MSHEILDILEIREEFDKVYDMPLDISKDDSAMLCDELEFTGIDFSEITDVRQIFKRIKIKIIKKLKIYHYVFIIN